ncbi:MAG: lactonase family protein [Verrucomicrobiae bacterium]|nr:lactonase family protein [Verrucomicrobiae bacterium]
MVSQKHHAIRLYVASLNGGTSDGLILFRFDTTSGALTLQPSFREGVQNPLFLTTDPRRQFLFVADFVDHCDGEPGGAVCSYAIDHATGALRFLSRQSSGGTVPCYISVSADGKFIFTANYVDGKVAVHPVGDDGTLGSASGVVAHISSDPKKKAHAHSIVLDAANRFAFAGELGLDQVVGYRFDAKAGRLSRIGEWNAKAGAGPRHFKFHPDGRFAYVINELDSTLVAFAYDGAHGRLAELQALTTLPGGFSGTNYCADLHVHPSGRFLYGSNRGHDSIVIFAIDEKTGRLQLVGHEPTQGNFPRSFEIDPSGTWLVVGNEKSGNIVTFRIDAGSGKLTSTGHVAQMTAPAGLCWVC